MTDSILIEFNNVSKRFKLGQKLLLKQALLDIFHRHNDYFWALKDINIKIKRGETVGIIGKNGSGKSTILKLIAGIIIPTKGEIRVRGKIAPLIELGAGFHPELSGRENVFINGAILGMSKKDLQEKFEDIINFAEIREFIDTPIKHYSSGMYLRLGFSIAIHTNPNILLIDEILAVGDEKFKQKCYKKLEEFKRKKTTIVYVSHDLETVKSFCDRVIYINSGEIIYDGKPNKAVNCYLSSK